MRHRRQDARCVHHRMKSPATHSTGRALAPQAVHSRSRGTLRPSFDRKDRPPESEGAGKAGRWPRPWPASRKNSWRQSPQVWPNTPGLPCAMVLRFIRALPGDRLSCPRFATMLRIVVSATMRKRIARGISTGMPEPRDFTVASDRSSAWRPCCDPMRPPHPAPDVRDGREAPPLWDGMRGSNHDF